MDLKTLIQTVNQIVEEKGIQLERVYDAIETALAAAYKKEYSEKGALIRARLDAKTGELKFTRIKEVVDDTIVRRVEEEQDEEKTEEKEKEQAQGEEAHLLPRYNQERHIFIDEAQKIQADIEVGGEIITPLPEYTDFGRIAAQTAKQVILQKLREAERDSVALEFKDREGKIVSGVVQRVERGNVFIDLGRAMGVMFYNESIPGEHYRIGERLRFYVSSVQTETGRAMGVLLSRAHPCFISELFEMEVPEIADGIVEVKGIAREPGSRTKIAVYAEVEGVDPVGSCVGQRGTRVMTVTNELGNEKIDIIEWSPEPERFISNALSPAKVQGVKIVQDHEARVFVADDQLSLAIGKGGQNVRLAAKLTGWRIDVRSQSRPEESQEGGIASAEKFDDGDGEEHTEINVIDEEKPIYRKVSDDE
ncbi:MAG: transcription termination factor NusA [bacterium]